MRRIRVRKHKRKKRNSSGFSVVKQHLRRLNTVPKGKEKWMERYYSETSLEEEEPIQIGQEKWEEEEMPIPISEKTKPVMDWTLKTVAQQPDLKRASRLERWGKEQEELIKVGLDYSTRSILSRMNLPRSLYDDVYYKAVSLWEMPEEVFLQGGAGGETYKGMRGRKGVKGVPENLSAIALYLVSLERNIFIPLSKILDQTDPEDHNQINRFLRIAITKDTELYRKVRSPNFRQNRIRLMLLGLQDQFNLPPVFYQKASEKLKKNFKFLNNQRDVLIAGVIWDNIVKELYPHQSKIGTSNFRQGYDFLGIDNNVVPSFLRRYGVKLKQPENIEEIDELWFLF
jgi:hypothetical protein